MYEVIEVVQKIKDLARQKGIKTSEMLVACELSKNALSSMSGRGSWIQANSLAKIADYLNCSVDYLLGRTDEPTSNTNITGNTQNNINGSNNIGTAPASADGISEKFMQIFNNLPFEQQLEIMSLALEKSKKI